MKLRTVSNHEVITIRLIAFLLFVESHSVAVEVETRRAV